jgi:hypothetical protein
MQSEACVSVHTVRALSSLGLQLHSLFLAALGAGHQPASRSGYFTLAERAPDTVPELVWMICGTETSVRVEKRSLYRPAHSLVTTLTELSPLLMPTIFMSKCLLMTVGDLK